MRLLFTLRLLMCKKQHRAIGSLSNSSPLISAFFKISVEASHNYLTAGHYLCVAITGIYASV